MKTVIDFQKKKNSNELISLVTCYDYWSARIISETEIDAVLVGDSAAMVMHGFDSTVNAEVEMMLYHIAAVKRGLGNKFLIGDLPFIAHRKGISQLMNSIDKYMKVGAQAIKIEGAEGQLDIIEYVIKSGVPVMGHLGLTPQFYHQLGGHKLQGTDAKSASKIVKDARHLQDIGVFALVLEMLPTELAGTITDELSIPTIGIGAGSQTNGQVLVLHDLLGLTKNFEPKFLRKYMDGFNLIKDSLNEFDASVKSKNFPTIKESYS